MHTLAARRASKLQRHHVVRPSDPPTPRPSHAVDKIDEKSSAPHISSIFHLLIQANEQQCGQLEGSQVMN
ncbi:unnamed protein product [Urochloa humidicola]